MANRPELPFHKQREQEASLLALACPNCGFAYAWDGAACGHCHSHGGVAQSDSLIEEVTRWRLWLWVPGLLLAGPTGWYPADRWESFRKPTSAWCVVVGGAAALALALLALVQARSQWWAMAARLFLSAVIYLIVGAIVWCITMMRNGFGGN